MRCARRVRYGAWLQFLSERAEKCAVLLQVKGYPTWDIGGRLFAGEKSLEELTNILDEMERTAAATTSVAVVDRGANINS